MSTRNLLFVIAILLAAIAGMAGGWMAGAGTYRDTAEENDKLAKRLQARLAEESALVLELHNFTNQISQELMSAADMVEDIMAESEDKDRQIASLKREFETIDNERRVALNALNSIIDDNVSITGARQLSIRALEAIARTDPSTRNRIEIRELHKRRAELRNQLGIDP